MGIQKQKPISTPQNNEFTELPLKTQKENPIVTPQNHELNELPADTQDQKQIFTNTSCEVNNTYPVPPNNQKLFPTPQSVGLSRLHPVPPHNQGTISAPQDCEVEEFQPAPTNRDYKPPPFSLDLPPFRPQEPPLIPPQLPADVDESHEIPSTSDICPEPENSMATAAESNLFREEQLRNEEDNEVARLSDLLGEAERSSQQSHQQWVDFVSGLGCKGVLFPQNFPADWRGFNGSAIELSLMQAEYERQANIKQGAIAFKDEALKAWEDKVKEVDSRRATCPCNGYFTMESVSLSGCDLNTRAGRRKWIRRHRKDVGVTSINQSREEIMKPWYQLKKQLSKRGVKFLPAGKVQWEGFDGGAEELAAMQQEFADRKNAGLDILRQAKSMKKNQAQDARFALQDALKHSQRKK